ncbi:MAG TPA: transporter substrate-binding domain-containing protein [Fervidobacterium sp.]|nr:transporter substrate-binding domain-containing protein [Fervidobacterium sp.]HQI93541.1 transporter substrate-binding domain-containing protein [Fervidobacterium sp.]
MNDRAKNMLNVLLFPLMITLVLTPTTGFGLKVGYYDDYPLCYSENGQPKGIFIEILKETFGNNFNNLQFVYGEFSSLLKMLSDGELDIVTTVADTKERDAIYSFNKESVIMNWGVLVSNVGINSLEDLNRQRIAVNKGDTYYKAFKDMLSSFEIVVFFDEFDTYFDVLDAVDSGRYVAGVVSRLSYLANSEEFSRVKQTPFVFSPVPLKFATQKGKNLDVLDDIDNTIAKMKGSGKLTQLFNSYFSIDRTANFDISNFLIGLIIGIFAALLVSALIFRKITSKNVLYYKEAVKALNQEGQTPYTDELDGHSKHTESTKNDTNNGSNIVYDSTLGSILLQKYMELARREGIALSIITLEILNEHDIESDKFEDILSSFTKPGDFVFKLNNGRYIFAFYSYGAILLEVFRNRIHEMARKNGLEIEFILGYSQFNPNVHLDQNQLIYESFVELEKERHSYKQK